MPRARSSQARHEIGVIRVAELGDGGCGGAGVGVGVDDAFASRRIPLLGVRIVELNTDPIVVVTIDAAVGIFDIVPFAVDERGETFTFALRFASASNDIEVVVVALV